MTGAGVTAQLASGQTVQVGKFEFVAPDQAKQSQTQTTVYIGIDGVMRAISHLSTIFARKRLKRCQRSISSVYSA